MFVWDAGLVNSLKFVLHFFSNHEFNTHIFIPSNTIGFTVLSYSIALATTL